MLSQQKQNRCNDLGCAVLGKIVPTEKVEGRESKRMASQLEPSQGAWVIIFGSVNQCKATNICSTSSSCVRRVSLRVSLFNMPAKECTRSAVLRSTILKRPAIGPASRLQLCDLQLAEDSRHHDLLLRDCLRKRARTSGWSSRGEMPPELHTHLQLTTRDGHGHI